MNSFDIGTTSKKLIKVKDHPEILEVPRHISSYNSINNLFGTVSKPGLKQGSVFQLTGYRGLGKTTMMLQMLEDFSRNCDTAYISTEENEEQVLEKCPRLNVKNVSIGYITNLEEILDTIKSFQICVVDSFQMIVSEHNQKMMISKLVAEAKHSNCSLGIVCQLTKIGKDKGVSDIGHLCDQTIKLLPGNSSYFGMSGKAVIINSDKNRFGKTGNLILENGNDGYDFECPWNEELVDDIEKAAIKKEN